MITLNKDYQKIIYTCKQGGNYVVNLKACIAEITGVKEEYIGHHNIYAWLRNIFKQLDKISLYSIILDRIFESTVLNIGMCCEERIINAMCNELCNLTIKG